MTTAERPPATLRLAIDGQALAHNWRALDRMSGTASAGAAVKANAYGLGVDQVVPALREAGARDFFVAHWSEVEPVLAHVPPGEVAVLHGPLTARDAAYARALAVRPVINSLYQAAIWLDSGGGPCDLMVDTGINRLGLSPHEIGDPLVGRLEVVTLMSHLASADEDSAQNALQLARARAVFAAIPARRRSLANSAGIALGPTYACDLTRPGLSLYGGVPRGELAGAIRQAAFPQAALLQRRQLRAGDRVGYNGTYAAQHDLLCGVVSLGYADGYLRCWSGRGWLEYRGKSLPVLGRVSMDMVVIDLTQAPDLREGDWLNLPWNLPEAAGICGLSQYELLTGLGQRLREV
jgi:alanine racemase